MKAPKSTSEVVTRVMKSNKSRDTKPELMVRKALRDAGYRGYRTSYRKAPGSPDVAFVGKKVGIVVHGCFWHGCKKCTKRTPKTNADYWTWKVVTNRKRDARNLRRLKKEGWRVFVIWEHDVKKGKTGGLLQWLKSKRLKRTRLGIE